MDASNEVGEATAANTAELTAGTASSAIGIAASLQLAAQPIAPHPLLSASFAPASTDSELESLGSAISAAFAHPSTSYLLNPLAQPVRTFPYFNPTAPPSTAQSLPRNQPLSDALQAAQQQTPYVQQYLAAAQQQQRPSPLTPQVLDPLSVMNALNSYHQSNVQATNSLLSSIMAAAAATATAAISAPGSTGGTHHHVATPQPPGVAPDAQLASAVASSNLSPFALLGQQTSATVGHSCSCPAQSSTAAFLAPYLQQLPHGSGASAATNPALRAANSATLMRQQRKRNAAQLRDDSQSSARAKCPRYDDSFRQHQAGRSNGQVGLFTPPTTPPRVQIPPQNAAGHLLAAVARASAQQQQQQQGSTSLSVGAHTNGSGSSASFCFRCQGAIVPTAAPQHPSAAPAAGQPQALSMFLQNAASWATPTAANFTNATTNPTAPPPVAASDAESSTFPPSASCDNHSTGYSCSSCTTTSGTEGSATSASATTQTASNSATAAAIAAGIRTASEAYPMQYYAEQIQQMLIRHSQPSQLMSAIPENVLPILPHQLHQQASQQSAAAAAGLLRSPQFIIPPYAPPAAAATQMNRAIPTALTRSGSLNPSALLGPRHDHAALSSQRQQQRLAQNSFMNNYYANARVLVPTTAQQQQQQAAAAAAVAQAAQQQVNLQTSAPLIPDLNYLLSSNRFIMVNRQPNGTADFPALMLLNSADHPHAALFLNPADATGGVGPTMAVMHHAPEPQPVGASNDQIKRCTQIRNYVKDPDVPEQEKERCTVCLADFETGEDIRTLHCTHMFHIECIDRWLNYNKKCPVCRVDMDKVPLLITDSEACSMATT